jgi:hypothetical protein
VRCCQKKKKKKKKLVFPPDILMIANSHTHVEQFITSAGLGYSDCLEKSDLVKRATEASVKKKEAPAKKKSSDGFSNKNLAGYECIMCSNCDTPEEIDIVVILFHGYGATAAEFKFLPQAASSHSSSKRIGWVFPQAAAGSAGAPEWWQLDGELSVFAFNFPVVILKQLFAD